MKDFEEKEEQEFLESRIEDINRTIQENPKQEKYLAYDLTCFEEELQLIRSHSSLRAANRKIRKYLKVSSPNHPKSTFRHQ